MVLHKRVEELRKRTVVVVTAAGSPAMERQGLYLSSFFLRLAALTGPFVPGFMRRWSLWQAGRQNQPSARHGRHGARQEDDLSPGGRRLSGRRVRMRRRSAMIVARFAAASYHAFSA